jgi:replicative DNA helicase
MTFDNESIKIAEESVIGAILLDSKSVLPKVVDILTPDDFYYSDYKNTYKTILQLSSEGKPIDFVTVLNRVVSEFHAEEANVKAILLHACQSTPSVGNVVSYAQLVSGGRKARQLRNIGARLFQDEVVTAENASEIASQVMAEIYSLAVPKKQKRLTPIGEIATSYLLHMDKQYDKESNRVDTGFPKLDAILKGMSGGNLIILAARPKVGKTAFAATIAENVARNTGKKVAVFSLEMENSEVYERILSRNSGIEMNTLIDRKYNGGMPEKEGQEIISKVAKLSDEFYDVPLLISDNPTKTPNDIRLECRMVKDLGLIVIDYLQLLKPSTRCENRNQEIGSMTRELKIIASELGVPILLLSQLNRDKDEFERPTMRDLRDSGEIEQNANKIVLLWNTENHTNDLGMVIGKTVGVEVAANRRGSTGIVLMDFMGNYMTFTETDKKYEEPTRGRGSWQSRVSE